MPTGNNLSARSSPVSSRLGGPPGSPPTPRAQRPGIIPSHHRSRLLPDIPPALPASPLRRGPHPQLPAPPAEAAGDSPLLPPMPGHPGMWEMGSHRRPLPPPGAGASPPSAAHRLSRLPSLVQGPGRGRAMRPPWGTPTAAASYKRRQPARHRLQPAGVRRGLHRGPRYAGGYLSRRTTPWPTSSLTLFVERGDAPLFLCSLTMENHQPYTTGYLPPRDGPLYLVPV